MVSSLTQTLIRVAVYEKPACDLPLLSSRQLPSQHFNFTYKFLQNIGASVNKDWTLSHKKFHFFNFKV